MQLFSRIDWIHKVVVHENVVYHKASHKHGPINQVAINHFDEDVGELGDHFPERVRHDMWSLRLDSLSEIWILSPHSIWIQVSPPKHILYHGTYEVLPQKVQTCMGEASLLQILRDQTSLDLESTQDFCVLYVLDQCICKQIVKKESRLCFLTPALTLDIFLNSYRKRKKSALICKRGTNT